MRDGQSSLDVVCHGFNRCIGDIINRQNDYMISYSDPAVFASVTHKFWNIHICLRCLPAFGLQVVDLDMLAFFDISHYLADVISVFDDCISGFHLD